MKRSLILSDAEREARRELVEQNRLKRAEFLLSQRRFLVRLNFTFFFIEPVCVLFCLTKRVPLLLHTVRVGDKTNVLLKTIEFN